MIVNESKSLLDVFHTSLDLVSGTDWTLLISILTTNPYISRNLKTSNRRVLVTLFELIVATNLLYVKMIFSTIFNWLLWVISNNLLKLAEI